MRSPLMQTLKDDDGGHSEPFDLLFKPEDYIMNVEGALKHDCHI